MKIIRCFNILLVAACVMLLAGCKDDVQTDYRDAWEGSYAGYCEYHYSTGSDDHLFDTIYTDESMSVAKQGENELVIGYIGHLFPVNCNPEGNLTSTSNNPHSMWCGKITGDSLSFEYSDVSQGNTVTRHFNGKKQK